MLEGDSEIQTAEQFFDLIEKSGGNCKFEIILKYLESGCIQFEFALECAKSIQDFVYLDIDLWKLRDYVHDDKNEEQYLLILRQLINQRVRNEIVQLFTK